MSKTNFKDELVTHKSICLDGSCLVYLLSNHPQFARLCKLALKLSSDKKIKLFASPVGIAEILAKPKQKNQSEMTRAYTTALLAMPNFKILPSGFETAQLASDFMAEFRVDLKTAFDLAVCIQNKLDAFLTANEKLRKLGKVKVIFLQDFV